MKKVIRSICISSFLVTGLFFSSSAQTSADTATASNPVRTENYPDNSHHSNWSWVGLLGLIGLAGLIKPKPVEKHVQYKDTPR